MTAEDEMYYKHDLLENNAVALLKNYLSTPPETALRTHFDYFTHAQTI